MTAMGRCSVPLRGIANKANPNEFSKQSSSHRPALGLKSVGMKGRSLLKAQRLLRKGKRVNVPEHTSGELKPHKPDSSPSSEAIRLAQQGDSGAFETIYRQHSRRVYALCLRMLRD